MYFMQIGSILLQFPCFLENFHVFPHILKDIYLPGFLDYHTPELIHHTVLQLKEKWLHNAVYGVKIYFSLITYLKVNI